MTRAARSSSISRNRWRSLDDRRVEKLGDLAVSGRVRMGAGEVEPELGTGTAIADAVRIVAAVAMAAEVLEREDHVDLMIDGDFHEALLEMDHGRRALEPVAAHAAQDRSRARVQI